jgi:phosphoribosylformimino-5-aminoimidazole carboxamide ribonucleotide (ProFAR) isomerase
MSKPTETLEWTPSGAAVVAPTSGKQAAGYVGGERPPAEHFNWAFKTETGWQEYLKAGLFEGVFGLASDISPSAITGLHSDYNPTGWSTAQVIRQALSADASLDGLAGGVNGRLAIIVNLSDTYDLTLENGGGFGASDPENEFAMPDFADVVLSGEGAAAILIYDGTVEKWRVLSYVTAYLPPLVISAYAGQDLGGGDWVAIEGGYEASGASGAGSFGIPIVGISAGDKIGIVSVWSTKDNVETITATLRKTTSAGANTTIDTDVSHTGTGTGADPLSLDGADEVVASTSHYYVKLVNSGSTGNLQIFSITVQRRRGSLQ